LVIVGAYPFVEKWITGDEREHHVLDRPRNAPVRTAVGAAGVTFYAVLWAGAGTDLIATNFKMSLNQVLTSMQILLIVAPIAAFWLTKRIALSLQRKDREIVLHGRESGRIIRLPHGEFVEVHEPLDKYEMYKLVDFKSYQPTLARPNSEGKITVKARMRASLSKFYFQDRVTPVGQIELAAAHHDEHAAVEEAPVKKTAAKPAAKKPAAKATVKKPAAKKAAPKKK
jgi:ubiquinol-cytochrome c reductase cytochrome b subunit